MFRISRRDVTTHSITLSLQLWVIDLDSWVYENRLYHPRDPRIPLAAIKTLRRNLAYDVNGCPCSTARIYNEITVCLELLQTEQDVLTNVFKLYEDTIRHEAAELFVYKNTQPFDPHKDEKTLTPEALTTPTGGEGTDTP